MKALIRSYKISSNRETKIIKIIYAKRGYMDLFVFLVKVTTTPSLAENFHLAHLLKTDIKLETEIRPRYEIASDNTKTKMRKEYVTS